MTPGERAGVPGSSFSKTQVWVCVNFLSVGLNIFQEKIPGPGSEDVRTRVEDDLVKVVCGGTAPSIPAHSATCTDPHTQSVLSNRSVVLLSLVAEDTEQ